MNQKTDGILLGQEAANEKLSVTLDVLTFLKTRRLIDGNQAKAALFD